jgi:hypothetical protein
LAEGSGTVVVSESLTLPKFAKLRKGLDISHRLMQSTFRNKKDEFCSVEQMQMPNTTVGSRRAVAISVRVSK